MLNAVGLGAAGALLLTLATLTTNFVNIYMSSLAWKSLAPRASDGAVDLVDRHRRHGAQRRARRLARAVHQLHDGPRRAARAGRRRAGRALLHSAARRWMRRSSPRCTTPPGSFRGVSVAGVAAWAAGAAAFFAAGSIGGTLPALAVSVLVYRALLYTRRHDDGSRSILAVALLAVRRAAARASRARASSCSAPARRTRIPIATARRWRSSSTRRATSWTSASASSGAPRRRNGRASRRSARPT